MGEAIRSTREVDAGAKVLDLQDVGLDRVFDQGNTALANSVRGVLENTRRPGESFAAHGSTT